jgi:hypothetical protein
MGSEEFASQTLPFDFAQGRELPPVLLLAEPASCSRDADGGI